MPLTNYALDNFVAHKISLLTECGAKEIDPGPNHLNAFILNTIVGPRSQLDPIVRAHVFNFIRRAHGARSSYQQARVALLKYVKTPRETISPYFTALLNFEVFISQTHQAYEFLATASKTAAFVRGDGSEAERLNILYNDSKHMNERIERGDIPAEATAAMWITNEGLESNRAALSFEEIAEILRTMDDQARKLSGAS